MKRVKRTFSLFVAVLLCGVCFSGCGSKKSEYDEETEENTELQEDMIERPVLQPKLKEAKEKYENVVAWLNVPGTNIDYPVMQSQKDYTPAAGSEGYYYSRHAEDKKYRLHGSIFAFKENNFESRKKLSRNTVIMGHNMESGAGSDEMFAQMQKYFDINFANEHPYIFLSLPDTDLVFQIFAVYITEIPYARYSPKEGGFVYYASDYMTENGKVVKGGDGSEPVNIPEGKSRSYVQVVAAEAKRRSIYNYPVKVTKSSKIITLSTCTYQYGSTGSKNCDATKFVIQGKLLSASKKLADRANLSKNMDPKPPQNLPNPNVDYVYGCEGELILEDDGKVIEVTESEEDKKDK